VDVDITSEAKCRAAAEAMAGADQINLGVLTYASSGDAEIAARLPMERHH
jgi:hypothetical protein